MAIQTLSPATTIDDATVGTVAWTNPDNAQVSDDAYATLGGGEASVITDTNVKIVKSNGSIGTTNKASGTNWSTTQTYYPYGNSTDLWGETWTAEDINDVDFGVVLSIYENGGPSYSHYLKATNFGFSIPTGATINGILVEIERVKGNSLPKVDHIRITVDYTAAGSASASPSVSPSVSPSASPSTSPSVSVSASPSISPSVSVSASPSISPSSSPSPSASPSVSISASPSVSPSVSPSISPSVSVSASPSVSVSKSPSVSVSASPSVSVSASPSISVSSSPSPSATLITLQTDLWQVIGGQISSESPSPSVSESASPSVSISASPSPSVAPGINMQINIGDVFKDVTKVQINVGGVWKDVTNISLNVGDTWRTVF